MWCGILYYDKKNSVSSASSVLSVAKYKNSVSSAPSVLSVAKYKNSVSSVAKKNKTKRKKTVFSVIKIEFTSLLRRMDND